MLRQIRIVDERVRPECLDQFALPDDAIGAARQQYEQVERLGRERNRGAGALQAAQRDVEAVRPELVHLFLRHGPLTVESLLSRD